MTYEIYNFGTPFLGHHYYILSLSDLCMGKEEKKILKEIMHFNYNYVLFDNALAQKPLPQGFIKFTSLLTLSWSSIYIFGLSDLCLRVQKRFFLK